MQDKGEMRVHNRLLRVLGLSLAALACGAGLAQATPFVVITVTATLSSPDFL